LYRIKKSLSVFDPIDRLDLGKRISAKLYREGIDRLFELIYRTGKMNLLPMLTGKQAHKVLKRLEQFDYSIHFIDP